MQLLQYEQRHAEQVAALLNEFLPFQLESAETIEQLGGIRFVYVAGEQVIGFIAGYPITNFYEEFPYFEQQLQPLKQLVMDGTTYYTSHFVVHPQYRNLGLGTQLVEAYMQQVQLHAKAVIVVGWVQSDIQKWTAKKQFMQQQFQPAVYIERYFEPYDVYCPNCNGRCYCDADIVTRSF